MKLTAKLREIKTRNPASYFSYTGLVSNVITKEKSATPRKSQYTVLPTLLVLF